MSLTFSEILLLLAAAQGLFLSLFIFHKYPKLYAVRFVGVLILLYTFILLGMVINDLGYSLRIPDIYFVILALPFVIGPLHYLFALFLVNPHRRLQRWGWMHFFPFAAVLLGLPVYVALSGKAFIVSSNTFENGVLPLRMTLFNWLILIHAATYTILSVRVLKTHVRKIKSVFSSIERVKLKWLLNVTYFALLTVGLFFIENLFMSFGINLTNNFTLTSVMVAIYVYTLGYMGLMRADVFADPRVSSSMQQAPVLRDMSSTGSVRQKYQKSGLSAERAGEYLEILIRYMETNTPYRDNGLTLNQLAEMVDITPHNLSEVLNTKLGQSFFDFVNTYRVDDVKKAIIDPTKRNFTLLALAFDAGFNSKTAFNTIFKKYTGKTPSEFRAELLGEKKD